ncbi:hypothetical protein [Actinoplanes flavus]|uniref:Type II restriction endonuclease subunit M n=1 Tax=Actinoplanes flavus TaxID=2820290 RepID=A0ABS3UL35_9ACTN|nr:hypothetical protein [Actinoplanes flavus]MBO3739495.1 hypothetical protein [Actinoplanes flavus]
MTIFLKVLDAEAGAKSEKLLLALNAYRTGEADGYQEVIYEQDPKRFFDLPNSPFAYWATRQAYAAFRKFPPFETEGRVVKQGVATADDFRFLRAWWEISPARVGERWFAFAKGGTHSRFYSDLPLLIGYSRADQVGIQAIGRYGRGASHYFLPGLTWPRRTQSGLGVRVMPAGCIFADKGPSAFVKNNDPSGLLALLAVMTSSPYRYLVELQMAFGSYEVGVIQRTPIPEAGDSVRGELVRLAHQAWSLKRRLDSLHETSHAFALPPGLAERDSTFDRSGVEARIQSTQREIDDILYTLYGLEPHKDGDLATWSERALPGSGSRNDESAEEGSDADSAKTEASLALILSWLAGVAFGRFDLRLVTGERSAPPEPEPFDPLPKQSPGMWPAGEERPAPPPGILVEDPGHPADITSHVATGAERVGVVVPEDLRRWLAREFFPLHIKMYSKSRRKAPIYWQVATPSASYSVWLYIHAFTSDTMFRVQNEYVVPKLRHEERRLEALEQEAGERATAAQRKAIAEQESFVSELRGLLDEVKRVAPLWNPDLDDGVIINFAPLWRLVPHHRQWQKELKATWDALCAGRYDWAHLAMRVWPERVVPKCATDRSLAIAHELEDVFWVQGLDGRWVARPVPTRSISEIVAERTSDAVKAALRSLVDAPTATRSRVGRRRTAAGASRGGR